MNSASAASSSLITASFPPESFVTPPPHARSSVKQELTPPAAIKPFPEMPEIAAPTFAAVAAAAAPPAGTIKYSASDNELVTAYWQQVHLQHHMQQLQQLQQVQQLYHLQQMQQMQAQNPILLAANQLMQLHHPSSVVPPPTTHSVLQSQSQLQPQPQPPMVQVSREDYLFLQQIKAACQQYYCQK